MMATEGHDPHNGARLPRVLLEALQVEAGQAGDDGMVEATRRAMRGDLEALATVLDAMPEACAAIFSWRSPAMVQAVGGAILASVKAGGQPAVLFVRPREYQAVKAELRECCELERGPLFVGVRTGLDDALWSVRLVGDDAVIPREHR